MAVIMVLRRERDLSKQASPEFAQGQAPKRLFLRQICKAFSSMVRGVMVLKKARLKQQAQK